MRYDMNRRTSIRIELNDMKNVISVDYDYAGRTIIYADITLDKIMRMNLTTGKISSCILLLFFCSEMFYKIRLRGYIKFVILMLSETFAGHIHEVIQFNESSRYVEGIAYDWLNRDVFYTDVGSAEIGVVSIDGRFKKRLFGPQDVIKPGGIAVHPIKG